MSQVKESLAKPLTIGLLAQGGRNWVGGAELTKNLVVAASNYCRSENIPIRLQIIGNRDEIRGVTHGLDDIHDLTWVERKPRRKLALVGRVIRRIFPLYGDRDLWKIVKRHKTDFLYPYQRSMVGTQCRTAAWICDFQHKHLPEFFSSDELKNRDRMFQQIASESENVVVSSCSAKEDFETFLSSDSRSPVVLSFRVNIPSEWRSCDATITREKYCLPEKYFIVCNQFWIHKNHSVVLSAVEKLKDEFPDLVVAMTGRISDYRQPAYMDEILATIHQSGIHENCRLLGLIPKVDQINLVRAATAVIQPSLFEGWSTIVEESHALGKRILLSDLPVHREQNPPGAVFFDPKSPDHLADGMRRTILDRSTVCEDSNYSDRVKLFGKQFVQLAKGRRV